MVWSRYDDAGVPDRRLRSAVRLGGDEARCRDPVEHEPNDFDFVPAIGDGRKRRLRRGLGELPRRGSGFDVFAKRFNSAGARIGGEFLVNTNTPD